MHYHSCLVLFMQFSLHTAGAFGGSLTAGILGRQYSVMSIGSFYLLVAAIGTLNGGMMVVLAPTLKRWVHVSATTYQVVSTHPQRPVL